MIAVPIAPDSRKRSILGGLDAAAVSVPMTLGGTVILYSQIAPEWLGYGILAGCLGMILVHAMTAHISRPVVYAARFFEAATLAAMVQQLAAQSAHWGLGNTPGVRVAMACIIVALGGLIVGALWLLRAERFARFVPVPVYTGFTNSVAIALFLLQVRSVWHQMEDAAPGSPVVPFIAFIVVVSVALRRWRPLWPPGATALLVGALLALLLAQLGASPLPLLTVGNSFMLPVQLADFHAMTAPGVNTPALVLALLQNGVVLGALMFLNTVITGQALAQVDERHGMGKRDALLQAVSMSLAGAAGCAPVSGGPNVANVVMRRGTVTPLLVWTVAIVIALVYATHALALLPLAALTGIFFADGWAMWDRPSARNFWAWLRGRPVTANAKQDLVVIVGVMAASLLVNMVAALVVGLLLGLVLHAHRNTRTPVRQIWTGREISSNCARSSVELALLRGHGDEIKVLMLDSNQFFVSANQLSATIKAQLSASHTVILDWSGVRNIDTSLTMTLARLEAHASKQGVLLVHAGTELEQDNLHREFAQHLPQARLVADLDRGLELAENRLIEKYQQEMDAPGATSAEESGFLRGLSAIEQELVTQRMLRKHYAPGDAIVTRGERADGIHLVLEGTGSVVIAFEDKPSVRLAGVRNGTLIGEIGFLDGALRSATVVADSSVVAMLLGRDGFEKLSDEHPRIAQRLLVNISLDLATRLRNTTIQAAARHRNTVPKL
ncbi:MAG: cyclic nucleotide-binding domain-containing protein [Pseudomonadota bacterium]